MSSDGNSVIVTGIGTNLSPYIYRFKGGSWDSGTSLTGQAVTDFGWCSAMSADGNTVIVTGRGLDETPYVYRFTGGSWDSGTLLTGKAITDFGWFCDMSADGNTVIVTGRDSGATPYVYRFTGGSWDSGTLLLGKVVINFGQSTAMSADGNTVVVTGTGSGETPYVYRFTGGSWDSGTLLTGKAILNFGWSCDMSADGNTIIVTGNDLFASGLETPYVYRFTNGSWDSGTAMTAQSIQDFGTSSAMSADGNSVIVTGFGSSVSPYVYVLGPRFKVNNTLNVYGGNVGIGTTTPTATLTVSGNLYYSEDLTKRAPHIVPTVANAAIIQAWISATCNVVDQQGSFWAPSSRPAFSNVATSPIGSAAYVGSVSLPDGRVLFVPYNAATVGLFNPFTNQFSAVTPTNFSGIVAPRFFSGVNVPSGNVIFVPYTSSNIGSYNPTTGVYANVFRHNIRTPAFEGGVLDGQSNVTMVPSTGHSNICAYNGAGVSTFSNMVSTGTLLGFSGAVLLPTGNIMCIPDGTSNIVQYSPTARTYSNSTVGSGGFQGGVLTPNGNVVCIPNTNANVVVVNPSGNPPYAFSNIQVGRTGGGGFAGGVLLPSGNIVCVPYANSNAGMLDPGALTYSNITPQRGAAQTNSYYGGSLSIDGRVIFCPYNSTNVACVTTTTPVVPELRLAPYFNKF